MFDNNDENNDKIATLNKTVEKEPPAKLVIVHTYLQIFKHKQVETQNNNPTYLINSLLGEINTLKTRILV